MPHELLSIMLKSSLPGSSLILRYSSLAWPKSAFWAVVCRWIAGY